MKYRPIEILLAICFGPLFLLGAALMLFWIIVFLLVSFSIRLLALIAIWLFWLPRGKDLLFVYSESPNWEDFLKREVIPQIEDRAYILNWSERSKWQAWRSFPVLVFHLFAGRYYINPLGLHFKLGYWPEDYRFLQPFLDFKHGNAKPLEEVLSRFYQNLGVEVEQPTLH